MTVPTTCLDCGALTRGTRCPQCRRSRESVRNAQPKRMAYRDPRYLAQPKTGRCVICGGAGADTRDHVIPIDVQMSRWGEVRDHRTQPAHRSCNSARGNRALQHGVAR